MQENKVNDKQIKMKNAKFNPKKSKKQLDILWSKAVRDRDKCCQKCGGTGGLQAAHIFSRGNLTTRWDKTNGIALCYACHIHWAHRRPVEFTLWVVERLGKVRFAVLKRKSQKIYDSSDLKKDQEKIKEELEVKELTEESFY